MIGACSCEHKSHFEDEWKDAPLPHRGTQHHEYGEPFDESELVSVKTLYGTFAVCKACADAHLANWKSL